MRSYLSILCILLCSSALQAQTAKDSIYSFPMGEDARITIDMPAAGRYKNTILICYALPNGNTTEQTMGRRLQPGDDWHFDIQHIRAQTLFVRKTMPHTRVVLAYFENTYKSWPSWKTKHADYAVRVQQMVDTVYAITADRHAAIYLNGHSGGGRFIFSYLDAMPVLPERLERISFLDSDYGYDSGYFPKLHDWLKASRRHCLNIF
ncbi:MAG: hypothetical protein JST39_12495, partial [Bacteroidetes bacterium]|nr:hypothetical protein [Bacteroidota bacterium]